VGKFEVDPRGARIVGISELDAGRQDGGDDVTVTMQPAVRALVGALGEGFGHPGPAQAMLGQCGGSGAGAKQPAAGGLAFTPQDHAPVSGGALDANLAVVDVVKAVAAQQDATPAQIALAWLRYRADALRVASVPIPGTRRAARVEENLGSTPWTRRAPRFPASATKI
jgi:hypothetical protein